MVLSAIVNLAKDTGNYSVYVVKVYPDKNEAGKKVRLWYSSENYTDDQIAANGIALITSQKRQGPISQITSTEVGRA